MAYFKMNCSLIAEHTSIMPFIFRDDVHILVIIHVSWMHSLSENIMVSFTRGRFLCAAGKVCHFSSASLLHVPNATSQPLSCFVQNVMFIHLSTAGCSIMK